MTNNILSSFPNPYKPRDLQAETLLELEASWTNHDIFILGLPVASGKSMCAKTIIDYYKQGAIITPTNLLVNQYRNDFPKLAGIVGRANYQCSDPSFSNCNDRINRYKNIRKTRNTCPNCPWLKDHKRMFSPWVNKYITNYHLYAGMGKYQPVLIVDEAHNLIDFLREWHAVKISYKKFKYPRSPGRGIDRQELKDWLNKMVGIKDIVSNPGRGEKGLAVLYKELTTSCPSYLIKEISEPEFSKDTGEYLGERLNLCLLPMDIRAMPSILYPPGTVKKIILMSATINKKDIEELGLDGRRVKYIQADSCIPPENRPVKILKEGIGVKGTNLEDSINQIARIISSQAAKHPGEKGLVHATYAQAQLLRRVLSNYDNRILYHDKEDKKQKYQEFRDAEDDRILVASGLYEGIDLPQDAGRWQVISKVPYPNLGEPAVKYKAATDREWYTWQASKTMLQACGRISRGPTDYGITYIVDNNFKILYNQNWKQYPNWFREAVSCD